MAADPFWALMMSGAGATSIGFALSSVSRSYREHRAQLLAAQRAAAAERDAEDQAWRQKVLEQLHNLDEQAQRNARHIARLEGAAGLPDGDT